LEQGVAARGHVAKEHLESRVAFVSSVDRQGMLRDQGRLVRRRVESLDRARPDGQAPRCRHRDEVERGASRGIHQWRRVLGLPSDVVQPRGLEDLLPQRVLPQAVGPPVIKELRGERRMVVLCNQDEVV